MLLIYREAGWKDPWTRKVEVGCLRTMACRRIMVKMNRKPGLFEGCRCAVQEQAVVETRATGMAKSGHECRTMTPEFGATRAYLFFSSPHPTRGQTGLTGRGRGFYFLSTPAGSASYREPGLVYPSFFRPRIGTYYLQSMYAEIVSDPRPSLISPPRWSVDPSDWRHRGFVSR